MKAQGAGYLKVILIKHRYTAYATAKDLRLSMTTVMSRTKSGKLHIEPEKCSSSVGDVKLKIKGRGLARLLNWFRKRIAKEIKVSTFPERFSI